MARSQQKENSMNDSGGAAGGVMTLVGLLIIVYGVLVFLAPIFLWQCVRRLTDIRDDIRKLTAQMTGDRKVISAEPASHVKQVEPWTASPPLFRPKGENESWASPPKRDLNELGRLMRENDKKAD
jgi:hypothetical protein